jgi:WD40 repeat protein
LGGLLVGLVAVTLLARNAQLTAESAQRSAILRNLSVAADLARAQDPRGALRLALAAHAVEPSPSTEARILETLAASPYRTTLAHHDAAVSNVSDPLRATPLGEPLTAHTDIVQTLTVSRDGRFMATAGWDKRILLWDVSEPRATHLIGPPVGTHVEPIYSMSFDGDGRVLASASRDKTFAIWNVADPAQPRPAAPPGGGADRPLAIVALSPDGRLLATGAAEGAIRLYDITDRGQPRPLGTPLVAHRDDVRALAFTPDGRTLLSGSTDGQVLRWDLGALVDLRRDAVAQACLRAGGPLDQEAWQAQTSGYPYHDPCPS